mmetsp:Transcript_24032/g.81147  ORF Transcript_24032/g.81147 Transcript_24032/m.81147 type:complete len:221 (+) Transcript_24032:985-1647(+)
MVTNTAGFRRTCLVSPSILFFISAKVTSVTSNSHGQKFPILLWDDGGPAKLWGGAVCSLNLSHQDVVPALPCSQDLRTRCQVPEHRLEADFPGLLQGPRVQQRPRRHLGFRRPRALGRRCGLRSVVGLARGLPCLPLGRLPRRPRPRGALAALGLTQSLGRRTHAPALVLRLLCFLDLGEFGCRHPLLLQRRMLSHRLLVLILERRLLLSAGSLPKLCKL